MLNWIKVWGPCWPVCSLCSCCLQVLVTLVLLSIKLKPWPLLPAYRRTYTSKISLTHFAAVIVSFWTINRSVFPCMLIPAHAIHWAPPLERSWLATHTGAKRLLDDLHTRTRLAVIEVHAKSGFVSELYWGPVIQRPPIWRRLSCVHALETCLDLDDSVASMECGLLVVWSSCQPSMKTVSACLHRNSYASVILQIILQGGNREKTSRLDANKSASTTPPCLTLHFREFEDCSWTRPCNSASIHSKDTCHISLGKPSLKQPDPSIYIHGFKTPIYS